MHVFWHDQLLILEISLTTKRVKRARNNAFLIKGASDASDRAHPAASPYETERATCLWVAFDPDQRNTTHR